MTKIIINADDFGFSSPVNVAISSCFRQGIITSTSLLANFEGFDEAIGFINKTSYKIKSVGAHLNLTEGMALTSNIKKCQRFCNSNGGFYRSNSPKIILTKKEKDAVRIELSEQLEKIIRAGVFPTHIDSHHHIHTEIGILDVFLSVAEDYGISKIRISRNIGVAPSLLKRIYKLMFNQYLKRYMSTVTYFGNIDDFLYSENEIIDTKESVVEVMTHPIMNKHDNIVDLDQKPLLQKIDSLLNYDLVSHAQF